MKTIHSGGAIGADKFFHTIGYSLGYKVINHSFSGHNEYISHRLVHEDNELYEQTDYLIRIAKMLGRTFPTKSDYVNKLLLRNFYQVQPSGAVVAIARIDSNYSQVIGGTGWAVEMAKDYHKPIYVFDGHWWEYLYSRGQFINSTIPRNLPEQFAGIGSRFSLISGEEAIKDVLTLNKDW